MLNIAEFDRKPNKRDLTLQLWDGGMRDRKAMAEIVGSNEGVVTAVLSRGKRLKRGENKYYNVRGPISIDKVAQERYKCTPSTLIKRLLETIAKDDLYKAVLGE